MITFIIDLLLVFATKFKAFVPCFSFFQQMIALTKYEKFFLFHLNVFFVLKIVKFLCFPLALSFLLSAIA